MMQETIKLLHNLFRPRLEPDVSGKEASPDVHCYMLCKSRFRSLEPLLTNGTRSCGNCFIRCGGKLYACETEVCSQQRYIFSPATANTCYTPHARSKRDFCYLKIQYLYEGLQARKVTNPQNCKTLVSHFITSQNRDLFCARHDCYTYCTVLQSSEFLWNKD
jgi:hypothetical protein